MSLRYSAPVLIDFARTMLLKAGLESDKAQVVAEQLIEGDLMGHTTHGLALLGGYLVEIEKGSMSKAGDPRVVSDSPTSVLWDGERLPGPWLTVRALQLAAERAKKHGTCTIVIRRSHHIACLAAFLRPLTEQGMMAILTCNDPAGAQVAPHGGKTKTYTPNPFAAAWPTDGAPVIIDVCMSITTNGMIGRCHAEKRPLPGEWLLDPEGQPTDDPSVMFASPSGSLLPMGGVDHGHKGYALALFVEALTGGLGAHGRADPKEGWGATIFIQVMDPAFFGGRAGFVRETSHLADACRSAEPRPGFGAVRLPGESGVRSREEQLANGVQLYPSVLPGLKSWCEKYNVAAPRACVTENELARQAS